VLQRTASRKKKTEQEKIFSNTLPDINKEGLQFHNERQPKGWWVEHLSSKHEAPCSNPSTDKN
jgi:hypothetical protein